MSKNSSAFNILYHPRSLKFLKKIPKKEATNVLEKLEQLADKPNTQGLDVKKLATTQKIYRLRIGKIRVVYEVDNSNRTIYIQDIDFRGNVY